MEREVSIQDLLDRIKREGLEEANQRSQEILGEAREKAETILRDAENEAERILNAAGEEVRRKHEALERELSQSGRDLILSVKQEITDLFDRILVREVRLALAPDVMKQLILKLVDKWRVDEPFQGVEVLFNEEQRDALEAGILRGLRDELRNGFVLKPVKTTASGFRIGEKDGNLHYDFTDAGIADALREYLNPRVASFLAAASRDDHGST
jgi:V/A-type H+-transporting ATPase subunit E